MQTVILGVKLCLYVGPFVLSWIILNSMEIVKAESQVNSVLQKFINVVYTFICCFIVCKTTCRTRDVIGYIG